MRKKTINRPPVAKESEFPIGAEIDADEVRLINDDAPPEIISLEEALKRAEAKGQDLVQVSMGQDIPVVKIIDYGKYRFDFLKKQKEARKKQKVINIKEVKLRPKIDNHDYETKVSHAKKFLEKGDKVKVTMMFRGREMAHKEIGIALVDKFREAVQDMGLPEKDPQQEGANLIMILAPKRKK